MLTTKVAGFLQKARVDAGLAEQARTVDSYEDLAELARRSGEPATAGELRAASRANSRFVVWKFSIQPADGPIQDTAAS